ncbi:intradiol ring-cleavage dioxygenase [Maribacter confluentis]|uniref:Intradiol ring-cleavage dioxygenase n=1 Tax=Maribacter confluentis TaxID=1656093 RepID=A0ABT8RS33_9FLAO|nr:intradiol ring-cleavage dioxygenase [Maribacter confluentis]MDO1513723.1 intradiol ring-cleavage dioxygenase [Maribacter confluentis]
MKRKDFLTKVIIGLGGIAGLATILGSRSKDDGGMISEDCALSPKETKGPFPNKTPSEYVRENIIGDRKGIALRINLRILDKNKNCRPMSNALVDVWHCDSHGKYSEYGNNWLQSEDLTKAHFLRGRHTSDADGKVSFISIFPGYYPGRAPHIHLEVLNGEKKSLLVTQIAFPEDICDTVYSTESYKGSNYVSNARDGIFRDSLDDNMVDSITGNIKEGYTLLKTIMVKA